MADEQNRSAAGDPETIRVYDNRAADYAEMTDRHNVQDPQLSAFLTSVPPAGTVLDLGCGPGAAAAVMAQAGLAVTAIDASAEMVSMAAAKPGVDARQGTFDQIDTAAGYDGVWASFSLLHAPRSRFPEHLKAIHDALKPGGSFFIAMKLGTGEARDGIGRFYTYYTQEELEGLVTRAGFSIETRVFGKDRGMDGTMSDWMQIAAHA